MKAIPFNRPALAGNELAYMREASMSGHLAGDGAFTKKCNTLLETIIGAKKVLLTTSCTHALEMAALLLDLRPGDEVIVPSFTFVSTLNAFVLRGAVPIFADIRPDTLNIDETKIEGLVTPRTRVIVPVHYAGVACAMDVIGELATRHRLEIVEDNAHGLFARGFGKTLGTFGGLATQSFHETKNIICGEGGALVINDARYFDRAEIIREKGTNRSRFFRGQVDKYTWVDIGSSYLPSELLAAFLLAQLEQREEIQAKRKHVWDFYQQGLHDWAQKCGVLLPVIPHGCEQPFHLFYLLLPTLKHRQALIAHLKSRGVQAVFHYLPLHLSDMGRKFGGEVGMCPVTEEMSDRLLRLPFFNDITPEEQERVVAALHEFIP